MLMVKPEPDTAVYTPYGHLGAYTYILGFTNLLTGT